MCYYVVYNIDNHRCWNDDIKGWMPLDQATAFYDYDVARINFPLPAGGQWLPAWEVDYLQAVRLITELEGLDKLGESTCYALAEEMGLDVNEVYDIIDRAKAKFDSFKSRLAG